MKIKSLIFWFLTSCNLLAGELKLSIDPVLKSVPNNTNLFYRITVHYTGPATNYFIFKLIPSETVGGESYNNLGIGISLSRDQDWKNIKWYVNPRDKQVSFFRAAIIAEK